MYKKRRLQDWELKNKFGLTGSQLRRFYEEAKNIGKNIKTDESNFDAMLPIIKMMKSKAAYAYGKEKIPKEFKDFIFNMIDSIKNAKEYKAFLLCFEAVVGYFYGEGGKQR